MIVVTFFVIFLFLVVVMPLFFYRKVHDDIELNCSVNTTRSTRGQGFFIVPDILDELCRQTLVEKFLEEARRNKNLNEDRHLSFYSNSYFLDQLSSIVGEPVYPVNSLDLQRCWLRYYFEGMKSQYYENYHHDIKRYKSGVKQYRLVIPVYDTSDSVFTIDTYGEFPFTQNTGVFLEADNCLHKVKFTRGERLLLIMDFTTRDCDSGESHYTCRGIGGYSNWIKDVVWRNISSMYYKSVNLK